MSHAVLSPSSAARWLSCTPSARLEAQYSDRAGQAAAEGTLAHHLGEAILASRLGLIQPHELYARHEEAKKNSLYSAELWDYAAQYAGHVLELYGELRAKRPDAEIFLERVLDLREWVEEGFGTSDATLIADGDLHIVDLKYGKGVPVSSEANKQMMLYALGAL